MQLFILGIIKVVDNMISTAKSITTYKNKKILTSLLVVLSQFLFYFLIKSVVDDDSMLTTIVVCVCSGVGTYIAMYLNDIVRNDSTYTNILTCSCTDSIEELCDYLLGHKIKYIPVDSYNRDGSKSKTVLIFARTKKESSLIDSFVHNSKVKYLREVIK